MEEEEERAQVMAFRNISFREINNNSLELADDVNDCWSEEKSEDEMKEDADHGWT